MKSSQSQPPQTQPDQQPENWPSLSSPLAMVPYTVSTTQAHLSISQPLIVVPTVQAPTRATAPSLKSPAPLPKFHHMTRRLRHTCGKTFPAQHLAMPHRTALRPLRLTIALRPLHIIATHPPRNPQRPLRIIAPNHLAAPSAHCIAHTSLHAASIAAPTHHSLNLATPIATPIHHSPHLGASTSHLATLSPSPTPSAMINDDESDTKLVYEEHSDHQLLDTLPDRVSLEKLEPPLLPHYYTDYLQGTLSDGEGQSGSPPPQELMEYELNNFQSQLQSVLPVLKEQSPTHKSRKPRSYVHLPKSISTRSVSRAPKPHER